MEEEGEGETEEEEEEGRDGEKKIINKINKCHPAPVGWRTGIEVRLYLILLASIA